MNEKEVDYRNKRQDEDIKEIRKHLGILNNEVGEIKVEMAKKFGEVLTKLAEVKASKKENVYAVIVPILMLTLGALLAWALSKL